MRWLRLVSVAVALSVVVSACVLRPRYADLATLSEGSGPIVVTVIDDATGAPLANVPVTVGEGQGRIDLRTDAQGRVSIPREDRLRASNALIVVRKPQGVTSYRFERAPSVDTATTATSTATSSTQTQRDPVTPALTPDGGVGPGQPPGGMPPSRGGTAPQSADDAAGESMIHTTVGDAGAAPSNASAQ